MKYTRERIKNTDTHTFEAKPKEGILTSTREWAKRKVKDIDHNWYERMGFVPVCMINGGYFGNGPVGGMMADSGYYNNGLWSNDKKWITLIYENEKLILDEEWQYDQLELKYPEAVFMRQVGDPLVKDGRRYKGDGKFDHTDSRNPRTSIGQKEDGTIVMFVTDGRGNDDVGYTMDELAGIALEKDCVTAVNLDGGGSSTMAIEGETVNDNEDRMVYDAFIFYATGYNLEHIVIETEEDEYTGPIIKGYNFYWSEVQAEVPDKYFSWKDALQYIKNIILLACMLQIYRTWLKRSIKITHWYRPDAYTQDLKTRGYPVSTSSDHLEARAIDCNVPPTSKNIAKWKEICYMFKVYPSVGSYNWGVHCGFRYDKEANWDYR